MKKILYFTLAFILTLNFIGCSEEKQEKQKITVEEPSVLLKDDKLLEQYREYSAFMIEDFDIDFRVVTIDTKENISLSSSKIFTSIKTKSTSDQTLLLLINTKQNLSKVVVSKELELIYTDEFILYIEKSAMSPYFKDSKIKDGVFKMIDLFRQRAYEAMQGVEFSPPELKK